MASVAQPVAPLSVQSGSSKQGQVFVSSSSSDMRQQKLSASRDRVKRHIAGTQAVEQQLPHQYYYNTSPRHPPDIESRFPRHQQLHSINTTATTRATRLHPQSPTTPDLSPQSTRLQVPPRLAPSRSPVIRKLPSISEPDQLQTGTGAGAQGTIPVTSYGGPGGLFEQPQSLAQGPQRQWSQRARQESKSPRDVLRALLKRKSSIRRTGSIRSTTRAGSIRAAQTDSIRPIPLAQDGSGLVPPQQYQQLHPRRGSGSIRSSRSVRRSGSRHSTGTVQRPPAARAQGSTGILSGFSAPRLSRLAAPFKRGGAGAGDELKGLPYDRATIGQEGPTPRNAPMMLVRHRTSTRTVRGSPVREFFRNLFRRRVRRPKATLNFTEKQLSRQMSFSIEETPNRRSRYEVKSLQFFGLKPRVKKVPVMEDLASVRSAARSAISRRAVLNEPTGADPAPEDVAAAAAAASGGPASADTATAASATDERPLLRPATTRGRNLTVNRAKEPEAAELDYTSASSTGSKSPPNVGGGAQFSRKRSVINRNRSVRSKHDLPIIRRIDLYDNPNPALDLQGSRSQEVPEVGEALAFVEAWSTYLRKAVAVRVVLRKEIHSVEAQEEERWRRRHPSTSSRDSSVSSRAYSLTSSVSTVSDGASGDDDEEEHHRERSHDYHQRYASPVASYARPEMGRYAEKDEGLPVTPDSPYSSLSFDSSHDRSLALLNKSLSNRLQHRMSQMEDSLVLDSMYDKYRSLVARPASQYDPLRSVSSPNTQVPKIVTPGWETSSSEVSRRSVSEAIPTTLPFGYAEQEGSWFRWSREGDAQRRQQQEEQRRVSQQRPLPTSQEGEECQTCSMPTDEQRIAQGTDVAVLPVELPTQVPAGVAENTSRPQSRVVSASSSRPGAAGSDLDKPLPELPPEAHTDNDDLLNQFFQEISMLEERRVEAKRVASQRYRDSAMRTPSPDRGHFKNYSLGSIEDIPESQPSQAAPQSRGHSRSVSMTSTASGASLSRGGRNMRRSPHSRMMREKRMSLNTAWSRRMDDNVSIESSTFDSDFGSDRHGMLIAVGDATSRPTSATQEHFI